MNIHFIGPDRVETGSYRRRKGEKGPTAKGTKTPRSRAGQQYPGGKQLRRAFKELSRRQRAREATVSGTRKGGKGLDLNAAFQMPGSMKTRAR